MVKYVTGNLYYVYCVYATVCWSALYVWRWCVLCSVYASCNWTRSKPSLTFHSSTIKFHLSSFPFREGAVSRRSSTQIQRLIGLNKDIVANYGNIMILERIRRTMSEITFIRSMRACERIRLCHFIIFSSIFNNEMPENLLHSCKYGARGALRLSQVWITNGKSYFSSFFVSQIELVHIRSRFELPFFFVRFVICCRSRIYGLWNNLESIFNFVSAQCFFCSFNECLLEQRATRCQHGTKQSELMLDGLFFLAFNAKRCTRACWIRARKMYMEWRQMKKQTLQIKRENKLYLPFGFRTEPRCSWRIQANF